MKLRGIRKKLLFLLAFILDGYSEISIRNWYRYFYQPGRDERGRLTLSQTFSRMNRLKEIRKEIKNGEVYFHLEAAGDRILDEDIPLWQFENQPWDHRWRLLIYDIEETNRITRDLLRKKIKELGFVKWQESVYVTPHPVTAEINEYLKEKNLYPKCVCFEAIKLGEEDDKKIAYRLFNLGALNEDYFLLLKKLEDLEKKWEKKKISQNEALTRLREIIEKYKETILKDPFLPKTLLPQPWYKEETKKRIKRLLSILR